MGSRRGPSSKLLGLTRDLNIGEGQELSVYNAREELVKRSFPLWHPKIVVLALNLEEPHKDRTHDMYIAAMRLWGATVLSRRRSVNSGG